MRLADLLEISGTHYLPDHSYDRRTLIKVRASRACETVEEIALQDFLILLERLQFTSDWVVYREQTKDVDARFDLQDFISLNHMVEGICQRSAAEDPLLHEIKDAFRGAIRTPQVVHHYLGHVIRLHWARIFIGRWLRRRSASNATSGWCRSIARSVPGFLPGS